MQWSIENSLSELFTRFNGQAPDRITPLPPSGSNRQYFRLYRGSETVIAAFNPDVRENNAFLELSRHFLLKGLPVPEVYMSDSAGHAYLLEDLGDTTLFSLLPANRQNGRFNEKLMDIYRDTLSWLPRFQIEGALGLDFSICYPRHAFDRHSMMWDLNYFKYYFLKISGIVFDEQKLEDDFERFAAHLLAEPADSFMYRDFQSRNVMIRDEKPWFIDYQGGRKGPLHYDIASLLFDAKADIDFSQRIELLDFYMNCLPASSLGDPERFKRFFYDFVLMRIMQALGTYGFRGGVEKKALFLQSVPYALKNLRWLAENSLLPSHIPYLSQIIERIALTPAGQILPVPLEGLTIRINSFSFKRGVPIDESGHGGGFVFDCRALPNPGRLPEFAKLSGLDKEVSDYLSAEPAVREFIQASSRLVVQAVENYQERGFKNLMVNFGCTGGQHRSVYCARQLAAHIGQKFAVSIKLQHLEEKHWKQTL